MSNISNISVSHKLTSKLKVSLETTQNIRFTQKFISIESVETIKAFESEMQQIKEAFSLVNEIRTSLEKALESVSEPLLERL